MQCPSRRRLAVTLVLRHLCVHRFVFLLGIVSKIIPACGDYRRETMCVSRGVVRSGGHAVGVCGSATEVHQWQRQSDRTDDSCVVWLEMREGCFCW